MATMSSSGNSVANVGRTRTAAFKYHFPCILGGPLLLVSTVCLVVSSTAAAMENDDNLRVNLRVNLRGDDSTGGKAPFARALGDCPSDSYQYLCFFDLSKPDDVIDRKEVCVDEIPDLVEDYYNATAYFVDGDGNGIGDNEPVHLCYTPHDASYFPVEDAFAATEDEDGEMPVCIHEGSGDIKFDMKTMAELEDKEWKPATKYFLDSDGDGYGNDKASKYFCAYQTATARGYVALGGDCNDDDQNINLPTYICVRNDVNLFDHITLTALCPGEDKPSSSYYNATAYYVDGDEDGIHLRQSQFGSSSSIKHLCHVPQDPSLIPVGEGGSAEDKDATIPVCRTYEGNVKLEAKSSAGLAIWEEQGYKWYDPVKYFYDGDGDGYGNDNVSKYFCVPPSPELNYTSRASSSQLDSYNSTSLPLCKRDSRSRTPVPKSDPRYYSPDTFIDYSPELSFRDVTDSSSRLIDGLVGVTESLVTAVRSSVSKRKLVNRFVKQTGVGVLKNVKKLGSISKGLAVLSIGLDLLEAFGVFDTGPSTEDLLLDIMDQIQEGFQKVQESIDGLQDVIQKGLLELTIFLSNIELDQISDALSSYSRAHRALNYNNASSLDIRLDFQALYLAQFTDLCNDPGRRPEDIFFSLYGYACTTCDKAPKKRADFQQQFRDDADFSATKFEQTFGNFIIGSMTQAIFFYIACPSKYDCVDRSQDAFWNDQLSTMKEALVEVAEGIDGIVGDLDSQWLKYLTNDDIRELIERHASIEQQKTPSLQIDFQSISEYLINDYLKPRYKDYELQAIVYPPGVYRGVPFLGYEMETKRDYTFPSRCGPGASLFSSLFPCSDGGESGFKNFIVDIEDLRRAGRFKSDGINGLEPKIGSKPTYSVSNSINVMLRVIKKEGQNSTQPNSTQSNFGERIIPADSYSKMSLILPPSRAGINKVTELQDYCTANVSEACNVTSGTTFLLSLLPNQGGQGYFSIIDNVFNGGLATWDSDGCVFDCPDPQTNPTGSFYTPTIFGGNFLYTTLNGYSLSNFIEASNIGLFGENSTDSTAFPYKTVSIDYDVSFYNDPPYDWEYRLPAVLPKETSFSYRVWY